MNACGSELRFGSTTRKPVIMKNSRGPRSKAMLSTVGTFTDCRLAQDESAYL